MLAVICCQGKRWVDSNEGLGEQEARRGRDSSATTDPFFDEEWLPNRLIDFDCAGF